MSWADKIKIWLEHLVDHNQSTESTDGNVFDVGIVCATESVIALDQAAQ